MKRAESSSTQLDYQYPTVWPSSVPLSAGPWLGQTYRRRLTPFGGLTQQQPLRPSDLSDILHFQTSYPHSQTASNDTHSPLPPHHRPRPSSIMDSQSLLPPSFWDGMPPLEDTASWCRSASRCSSEPSHHASQPFSPQQSSSIASVNPLDTWSSTLSLGAGVPDTSPDWPDNSQLSLSTQQHPDSVRPSYSIGTNKLSHRYWSSPSLSYHSNFTEVTPGNRLSEAPASNFHQHLVGEHDLASTGLQSIATLDPAHQQSLAYNSPHSISRKKQYNGWNGFAIITQPQHYTPAPEMAWHSADTNGISVVARDLDIGGDANQEPFWNSQHVRTTISTNSGNTTSPGYVGPYVVHSPESLSNRSSTQLETEGSNSSVDLKGLDEDYGSGPTLANLALSKHYQKYKNDEFLVRARKAGWSYRKIREKGNFKEKESTLRGRYRNLSKEKSCRVRRPVWTERDLELLNEAIERVAPEVSGRKCNRRGGVMADDNKAPWKRVADYIAENGGSYHFGNATCRKKWDEINN